VKLRAEDLARVVETAKTDPETAMEKLQLSVRRELIVEAGAEKTTDLDDFQAWFAASQAQKRVIAKVALDELDAYRKRCENKRLLVTAHKASTSASKLGTGS
ncbi:unnamed protein product, partial [Aphanomyces euteiches]